MGYAPLSGRGSLACRSGIQELYWTVKRTGVNFFISFYLQNRKGPSVVVTKRRGCLFVKRVASASQTAGHPHSSRIYPEERSDQLGGCFCLWGWVGGGCRTDAVCVLCVWLTASPAPFLSLCVCSWPRCCGNFSVNYFPSTAPRFSLCREPVI